MDPANESPDSGWRRRVNWIFVGFLLIAAYFLITEHRVHLASAVPYLPFLLLLACPLMHVFMHRDHGGHKGHDSDVPPAQRTEKAEPPTGPEPTRHHRH